MLAGGWMSQFLSLWVSACGLSTEGNSGFLTVGWLASHSECPKEREQGGSCNGLALEATCCNFCHILLVTQTHSDKIWEGTIQKGKFWEMESLGAMLELTPIYRH